MPITETRSGLIQVEGLKRNHSSPAVSSGQKSIGAEWPTFLGNGWIDESADLTATKWGAAMAYLTVHQIHICVDLLINGVNSIPWQIVRIHPNSSKDDIISTSKDDLPRHPFHLAMHDFRRDCGRSLLATIMFDYMVYGEIYIEKSGGLFHNREIDWLNPLGVTRQIINGKLVEFRYGWNSEFASIIPYHMAYYHTRHPYDDFAGYSPVMAVMNKINISQQFDHFLQDFFRNNATPHLLFMPESVVNMQEKPRQNLEYMLRSQLQGTGNMHRAVVLPGRFDIQQLDLPNLEKFQIEERISTQIFEGMGIAQAIAGNTSGTPYKDGEETDRRYYLDAVFPKAKNIEEFINLELMPFFDPTGRTRFQFDYSFVEVITEADRLEADVVNGQLQSGYITLGEARTRQELQTDSWYDERYVVEGVPMTRAQIDALAEAKVKAAQVQSQITPFGLPALTGSDMIDDISDTIDVEEKTEFTEAEQAEINSHFFLNLYEGKSIYPDGRTVILRIADELRQWRDYELNRVGQKSAPFECIVTPIYIRHAVIDVLPETPTIEEVKQAFDFVSSELRRKGSPLRSISTYRRDLRSIVTQVWNGTLSESAAKLDLDKLVNTQLNLAIEKGVTRAGRTMTELTRADRNKLDGLIRQEQSYIPDLLKAVEENSKREGGALAPLRARIDLWVSRWPGMEDYAFALASQTVNLKWMIDPRKEHCIDCGARLNGKVYPGYVWIDQIGIWPRSGKLACFGGHCGCRFETTTEPPTRGRRPIF